MSDDNTAVAGEHHENLQGQEGVKEFTPIQSQDDLNKIVEARLARERAKFADYPELKSKAEKLAEMEEQGKSELEKAIARAEKAEQDAAAAAELVAAKDREVLVRDVAADKKVPAKYLTGGTREELEASADEFLADILTIAPDRKPGHIPFAGTGEPKGGVSSLDTGRARAQALLQTNS